MVVLLELNRSSEISLQRDVLAQLERRSAQNLRFDQSRSDQLPSRGRVLVALGYSSSRRRRR
jgi:hypothetical protein